MGKMFPILRDCNYKGDPELICWEAIEPYREKAFSIHGQTLERLAERGGLSYEEFRSLCE